MQSDIMLSLASVESAWDLAREGTNELLYTPIKSPAVGMQHFEDLIRENFVERGAGLLKSCEAYLQGAPVSHLHYIQMCFQLTENVLPFLTFNTTMWIYSHQNSSG